MSPRSQPLEIVVLGLSLSSTWGNGHATTFRSLLTPMSRQGHRITFLERDVPWYAEHRDLPSPDWCDLVLYTSLQNLAIYRDVIASADVVIIGSYVPDGCEVIDFVLATARGVVAFYDIDTPVTMSRLASGDCAYIAARQVPRLDLYLSFTGGSALKSLERDFGARSPHALYCSVDEELYRPQHSRLPKWKLGYLGTYSRDRQAGLELLLIAAAKRMPAERFVVAGSLYPLDLRWPENVDRIDHVSQPDHAGFYGRLEWALNLTRAEMVTMGHSPSVRLFEAAACGTPIISDSWAGIDELFAPDREIMIAGNTEAVVSALKTPPGERGGIAEAARQRVLAEHTGAHRAAQLEALLIQSIGARDAAPSRAEEPLSGNRA